MKKNKWQTICKVPTEILNIKQYIRHQDNIFIQKYNLKTRLRSSLGKGNSQSIFQDHIILHNYYLCYIYHKNLRLMNHNFTFSLYHIFYNQTSDFSIKCFSIK